MLGQPRLHQGVQDARLLGAVRPLPPPARPRDGDVEEERGGSGGRSDGGQDEVRADVNAEAGAAGAAAVAAPTEAAILL